jgi:hypothetical protein
MVAHHRRLGNFIQLSNGWPMCRRREGSGWLLRGVGAVGTIGLLDLFVAGAPKHLRHSRRCADRQLNEHPIWKSELVAISNFLRSKLSLRALLVVFLNSNDKWLFWLLTRL